jgi:hypothetical protein
MVDYESKVKTWFSNHGYEIHKISESNEETPDFFIADDSSAYILELKTKFPSDEEMNERRQVLSIGGIHNVDEEISFQKGLSKIISKAKNQLKNYKKGEDVLRLVWLLATDYLAEPRLDQFEATLYGSAYLYSVERQGNCYFFYNSDFFKYRETLDAAIVSTMSMGKLLLNPLSPRYEKMKSSSLIGHFKEGSVIDPILIEKDGLAFLVDSNVNRSDEAAVLQYLKEKHNIDKMIVMNMHYMSGTMDFDND